MESTGNWICGEMFSWRSVWVIEFVFRATCRKRLRIPINLISLVTHCAHVLNNREWVKSRVWVSRSLIHISLRALKAKFYNRRPSRTLPRKWVSERGTQNGLCLRVAMHRMRSTKVSEKSNETTAHWQLKICFRIKDEWKRELWCFQDFFFFQYFEFMLRRGENLRLILEPLKRLILIAFRAKWGELIASSLLPHCPRISHSHNIGMDTVETKLC